MNYLKVGRYTFSSRFPSELWQDTITMERDHAIYQEYWFDSVNDFRHVRILFTEKEAKAYLLGSINYDRFIRSRAKWAKHVKGIPKKVADRADAYHFFDEKGKKVGPPWHCFYAFQDPIIEEIICGKLPERIQMISDLIGPVDRIVLGNSDNPPVGELSEIMRFCDPTRPGQFLRSRGDG